MKNMKKLLAVGALLTLGTMAMAGEINDTQIFDVKLKVIAPLDISAAGELDFGTINATTADLTESRTESDLVTIKGGAGHIVDFAIATTPLTNINGGTQGAGHTLAFTAHMSDQEDGDKIESVTLNGAGDSTAYMVASIADFTGAKVGDYEGTITLTADYN